MVVAVVSTWLSATGLHPARVPISAHFSRTGEVQAVFGKRLMYTTSPGCGCIDDQPPGGWQGITLPAGNLEVGLRRKVPAQYDIFSPDPASWAEYPGHFGVPHQLGVILAPDSEPPSASILRSQRFPPRYIFADGFAAVSDWISFTAASPLHIASFGGDQLAALGPVASRPVSIGYEASEGEFTSEGIDVHAPFSERNEHNTGNGVPLVDVLGEQVILWAKVGSSQPHVEENYETKPPAPWHPNGRFGSFELEGVPLEPRLQRRAVPRGYSAWLVVDVPRKTVFSIRVVTRPAKRHIGPNENSERWPSDETDSAGQELVLRDRDVARASQSLGQAALWASQHRTIRLTNLALMKTSAEVNRRDPETVSMMSELYKPIRSDWVNFRFPPVPPRNGVNIFGTIRDLKLGSAQGQLVVGNTVQTPLVAGTPVELHDLAGQGVVGKHMFVPVQVEGSAAHVDLQGSAVVQINGVSVSVSQAWWRRLLPTESPVSFALALLAVAFSAMALRRVAGARES